MTRRRVALVRALVVAALALPQVAAICVPSGSWEVAATPDGNLIIFDSARNLFRSDDDGASWYSTDSLPLESARMGSEACVDDRCYRIRADRLGVEEHVDGEWATTFEYPPDRIEFAARQLPGPCGDGHGWLGLTGLMAGPDGSQWALLVPAGADGLLGLSNEGEWVRGVYGTPASLGFVPADLDLLAEGVAVGFLAVVMVILFGVLDFRRDTVKYLVAATAWASVVLTWWGLQSSGQRSLTALVLWSLVPMAFLLLAARLLHMDAAELFLGGFLGGAVGAGIAAIGTSHDSTSWGVVLAAIAGIVAVFTAFGIRGQLNRPSVNPIRLLGVGLVALGGAAVAWLPFDAWADASIADKTTADLIASGVAAIAAVLAWRLGRVTARI
ncbi:MAG: hypothetical protein JSV07_08935 [Acidimicrobiia bacterium]|nr:MAG: hypothetical protein JSV07_08935 [Acidimicrobiia bacterium]